MTTIEEALMTTTERETVPEKEQATNSRLPRTPVIGREISKSTTTRKSNSAAMVTPSAQAEEIETSKDAVSLPQSLETEARRTARKISNQITKGESLMTETTTGTKEVRVASQTTDDKINLTLFAHMRTDRQDLIID